MQKRDMCFLLESHLMDCNEINLEGPTLNTSIKIKIASLHVSVPNQVFPYISSKWLSRIMRHETSKTILKNTSRPLKQNF